MTSKFGKIPAPPIVVLLADDLREVLDSWARTLGEYGIPCMTASTLGGVDRAFALYQDDISAIILDGCIPGDTLNTGGFIVNARASGYSGPIIAASSSRFYRELMVAMGCSHQATKDQAAHLVADLLSRPVN